MTKKVTCRSMGMDCDYVAYGKDIDEIMEKGMEHAKTDHPEKYAEMMKMSPDEKEQMKMDMMAKMEDA